MNFTEPRRVLHPGNVRHVYSSGFVADLYTDASMRTLVIHGNASLAASPYRSSQLPDSTVIVLEGGNISCTDANQVYFANVYVQTGASVDTACLYAAYLKTFTYERAADMVWPGGSQASSSVFSLSTVNTDVPRVGSDGVAKLACSHCTTASAVTQRYATHDIMHAQTNDTEHCQTRE